MEVLQPVRLRELAEVRDWARSGEARRIRTTADVTLAEIGAAVGVAKSTVHRWETGQQRPSGEMALAYRAVLRRLRRQEHVR